MRHPLTRLALALAVPALLAACGGKPTPEQAQQACEHTVTLGYWKGFEGSLKRQGLALDDTTKKQGEEGLAEVRQGAEWKAQVAGCAEKYAQLGTAAQMECVIAAKTADEAQACLQSK